MKEQVINNQEIKYQDAGISELSELTAIYKNVKRKTASKNNLVPDDTSALTESFGLPLVFGKYGKEVIGFAAVVINSNHQIDINCYCKDGFETQEILQDLKAKAGKIVDSIFAKEADNSKLNASIIKLTNWWNSCN